MNKGLLRIGTIFAASYLGSYGVLSTIATIGPASAPKGTFQFKNVKAEVKKLNPIIVRNSLLVASGVTSIVIIASSERPFSSIFGS